MPCHIMAKGLWGEGTLQHRSREVCQHSGVFINFVHLDVNYIAMRTGVVVQRLANLAPITAIN